MIALGCDHGGYELMQEVVAKTVHREAVDAPTTFAEVVDLDYRTRAAAEMVVAELTQNG